MQALWLGRTGCVLAHRRRARRWSSVRECRSLGGGVAVSGAMSLMARALCFKAKAVMAIGEALAVSGLPLTPMSLFGGGEPARDRCIEAKREPEFERRGKTLAAVLAGGWWVSTRVLIG